MIWTIVGILAAIVLFPLALRIFIELFPWLLVIGAVGGVILWVASL